MQGIIEKDGKIHYNSNSLSQMFVTFNIGNEIYGIDVNMVREIIGVVPISVFPNSPDYLKGVINLRGSVVPVIDVRVKFRLEAREYDSTTVILILDIKDTSVGFIVDSVSDVIDIVADNINDYCRGDTHLKSGTIRSIASYNNNLILILDVDKILDHEVISDLKVQAE